MSLVENNQGIESDGGSDDKSLVTAKDGRLKIVIVNSYEIDNGSGGMNNDKILDQVTRKNQFSITSIFQMISDPWLLSGILFIISGENIIKTTVLHI